MNASGIPRLLVLLAHSVSASIFLQTLCYICGGLIGKVSKTVKAAQLRHNVRKRMKVLTP
jgi:hypothetical protein